MKGLSHINLVKLLKALLVFKVMLVTGVFLFVDKTLYFGDVKLFGADVTDKSSEKPDQEMKTQEPEVAGKQRQSFLANLLELPPLDPEAMQKDEIGKYLEIAERKKRQLEERVELLKSRDEQLKKLEASIDEKLKRLDEERRFIAQTLQQEKDLKGERLDKLVNLYAKMEPKKAAPLFEKLDKDLVVELFKLLPQKQTTAILEGMNPERSVFLSEYYGRVRSAREYELLKEMNQSLRKEFDDCKGMPAAGSGSVDEEK